MPYCINCGTQVAAQASFCPNCGRPQAGQPGRGGAAAFVDPTAQISDRTASILCYIPVFGVIPSIIFLAIQRYRHNTLVRFNAFQSLYLFVAFLIVSSVLPSFFWFGFPFWGFYHFLFQLLKTAIFFVWIYLLIKAAQEIPVHLPVIGDLAKRSAAEQL